MKLKKKVFKINIICNICIILDIISKPELSTIKDKSK